MYINLNPGQTFAEKYRIDRCIGAGGMGAVFEAHHTVTRRQLAIKVMLPDLAASAEMLQRFRNEAQVTSEIQCDYVTQVLDAGVDAPTGMPYMVMEFLQGQELAQLLEKSGPIDPQTMVLILSQVAVALRATHAARIVHRDLKPENIFLTQASDGTPRVKVLDFGIAKVVAEAAGNNKTRGIGTPAYMAPEQFRGVAITPSVDIFSLGMIAFTTLVGSRYWEDECESTDFVQLALALSGGPVEPASARAARIGRSLPPGFDAWFAQCTARDPAMRFNGAVEAVVALSHALGVSPPALLFAAQGPLVGADGRLASSAGMPVMAPGYGTGQHAAYQTGPQPYHTGSHGYQTGPQPPYGTTPQPQIGYGTAPQAYATGHHAYQTGAQPMGAGPGGATQYAGNTGVGTSITNPEAAPQPKSRGGLYAAIALVSLCLVGGGAFALFGGNNSSPTDKSGAATATVTQDGKKAENDEEPVKPKPIAATNVTATAAPTAAPTAPSEPTGTAKPTSTSVKPGPKPTAKPTITTTIAIPPVPTITLPTTVATPAPTPTPKPTSTGPKSVGTGPD